MGVSNVATHLTVVRCVTKKLKRQSHGDTVSGIDPLDIMRVHISWQIIQELWRYFNLDQGVCPTVGLQHGSELVGSKRNSSKIATFLNYPTFLQEDIKQLYSRAVLYPL